MGFFRTAGIGLDAADKVLLDVILSATEYIIHEDCEVKFNRDKCQLNDEKNGVLFIDPTTSSLHNRMVHWNMNTIQNLQDLLQEDGLGSMSSDSAPYEMLFGMELNKTYLDYFIKYIRK